MFNQLDSDLRTIGISRAKWTSAFDLTRSAEDAVKNKPDWRATLMSRNLDTNRANDSLIMSETALGGHYLDRGNRKVTLAIGKSMQNSA